MCNVHRLVYISSDALSTLKYCTYIYLYIIIGSSLDNVYRIAVKGDCFEDNLTGA